MGALQATEPVDPADVLTRLREALDHAEPFVTRMPTAKMGLLFIRDGEVVEPDADLLDLYQAHGGQRRGHWPSSPEIAAAMLARFYNV
jgi:uncharacterized protein with von Willebrand factor type A (vWA) domain